MKNRRFLLYTIAFVGLAAAAFLWRCALTAILWAGWGGFGEISMEYTAEGKRMLFIAICVPLFLLLLLLLIRMGRNIVRKETISCYAGDMFFFAAAIGAGILFFYMPEPRRTIVDYFEYRIIQAGWMCYPAP